MARPIPQAELEAAFDSIEEMILPGISMMLDTLLDAAMNSQPGINMEVYAAELRTIGAQLEALTRQVEALSADTIEAADYGMSSAA